jgi:vacuolar-type H+-ATPase subunit I/STV1
VLSGRGKFQKRRVGDGSLEISTVGSTDDERLREWISESHAVLPRLRALVRNGHRDVEPLEVVVEDLRGRVEELEHELARLRREVAGA